MDERNELILLYDFYGELLTENQKRYFEDYYFNNFSLKEISETLGVSRNAVHKQLKMIEEKLKSYEEKLKLKVKYMQINEIINKIEDEKIQKELKDIIES